MITAALLTLFSQLIIFLVLLFKRPAWVREAGRFLLELAGVVEDRSEVHARRSKRRRRSNPHGAAAAGGLHDSGRGVLDELTSALVNLGASKSDAVAAAKLAMRSGITDFGELFKVAAREAAHVN